MINLMRRFTVIILLGLLLVISFSIILVSGVVILQGKATPSTVILIIISLVSFLIADQNLRR